jgi:hypothetical protein
VSVGAKLRVGLGVAFLLFVGYSGITGGLQHVGQSATVGQRVQTATQWVFGVLAVGVLGTLVAARRWTLAVLVVWGAVLSVSAGLATVVWGGTGLLPAVAAVVATALIAWLTHWLVTPATLGSPG